MVSGAALESQDSGPPPPLQRHQLTRPSTPFLGHGEDNAASPLVLMRGRRLDPLNLPVALETFHRKHCPKLATIQFDRLAVSLG